MKGESTLDKVCYNSTAGKHRSTSSDHRPEEGVPSEEAVYLDDTGVLGQTPLLLLSATIKNKTGALQQPPFLSLFSIYNRNALLKLTFTNDCLGFLSLAALNTKMGYVKTMSFAVDLSLYLAS